MKPIRLFLLLILGLFATSSLSAEKVPKKQNHKLKQTEVYCFDVVMPAEHTEEYILPILVLADNYQIEADPAPGYKPEPQARCNSPGLTSIS